MLAVCGCRSASPPTRVSLRCPIWCLEEGRQGQMAVPSRRLRAARRSVCSPMRSFGLATVLNG